MSLAARLGLLGMLLTAGCGRFGLKLLELPMTRDSGAPDLEDGDAGDGICDLGNCRADRDGGADRPGAADAGEPAQDASSADDLTHDASSAPADSAAPGQSAGDDAWLAPDDAGAGARGEPDAASLEPVDAGAAEAPDPCLTGDLCNCAAAAVPAPHARWQLDETSGTSAAEASGAAPNGTLNNFSGSYWTTGQIGGALSFDGVDDYVEIGNAGTGVQSLVFWVKPGSATVITNNTGQHFPSSTGPKNDWSNPKNAYADDGKNASAASLLGETKTQDWGGFHLQQALPPGVSILGITVSVETGNLGLLGSFGVELSWNAGSSVTSAGYSWGQLILGSSAQSAGGPDKLWGRTWTASDLSDANFRVRAKFGGLVNTMNLDYIEVQVQYSDYANPRNILNLNDSAQIEYTGSGLDIAASNWPGATIYVNGAAGSTLTSGWNQVVVTGQAISVSHLELGNVTSESPAFAFQGSLDDVALYDQALSALQVTRLYQAPVCGP
jgi:hypothetical protein